MLLKADNIQHVNSITHEGKVVLFGTTADGKVVYTVKQDGFEDSYLNTPVDQRTGWENWKELQFANETDNKGNPIVDQSVVDKEKAEFTRQDNITYLLHSLYQTQTISKVVPVQLVSAFGYIYVFRQSQTDTLLVDRFVLDGMSNTLNRKFDVRYKRSGQKYTPFLKKGENRLENSDSLDFRDANGKFFYEPTTELSLITDLKDGWFSVILVPTVEKDVYRWHIFAYKNPDSVEITTLRASEEGLFEIKDYPFLETSSETQEPRSIPGIIQRTLNLGGLKINNGLAATKYDVQEKASDGEKTIRTATRIMLAIPTGQGTAVLSFAIGIDGILSQIGETSTPDIIRSQERDVLLPLDTLLEIRPFTAASEGTITGLAQEPENKAVKITTEDTKAKDLKDGSRITITDSRDYQGIYPVTSVDGGWFEIKPGIEEVKLGSWKEEPDAAVPAGTITAYERTSDGSLRITCANHGLKAGDQVQILGTGSYNATFPIIQKCDDHHFLIETPWTMGEAVNVNAVLQKRRGMVFDGVKDYIKIPAQTNPANPMTVSVWAKSDTTALYRGPLVDNQNTFALELNGEGIYFILFPHKENLSTIGCDFKKPFDITQWHHYAATINGSRILVYVDGEERARAAVAGIPDTDSSMMTIGEHTDERAEGYVETPSFFKGQISEVSLWNKALTADEIKNSIYSQLIGTETGLVGYWRLGSLLDGKVPDVSVNGNDGIIHGNPYVSKITLCRNVKENDVEVTVVKHGNPELFAVTEYAQYQETFEFMVDPPASTTLANDIFHFSYWGKTSRSTETIQQIKDVKQDEFDKIDEKDRWYRASCTVTIPKGMKWLRFFEIDNFNGNWQSLTIRNHRIKLLSDTITEKKYSDSLSLNPSLTSRTDSRSLTTQGALLAFLKPASRLNAIETCTGNVQLGYFDAQGQARQIDLDAVFDSDKQTYVQWSSEQAKHFFLNCDQQYSMLLLQKALELPPQWSIEAWFSWPLPPKIDANIQTLIGGDTKASHIVVKIDELDRVELGIILGDKPPLAAGFYGSGFDMRVLSDGWHHLAAIGCADTTLFYIDGRKIGDVKARALATAPEKQNDFEKAKFKVNEPVVSIGNTLALLSKSPFGKVAEVRIWDIGLSDEEVMANSKTRLTGNEPGLLAYFPLLDKEPNGRDCSGKLLPATVKNASWHEEADPIPVGKTRNMVMQFDGVDDYLQLPEMDLDFSKGFTVEAWVWYDKLNSWSRIIDLGNGQQNDNIVFANNGTTGQLSFHVFQDQSANPQKVSSKTSDILKLGEWMHLAVTCDSSGKVVLFKNDEMLQLDNPNATIKIAKKVRTKNYLGKSNWALDGYLDGALSDVRIWNTVRTLDDIQKNMYKRLTGSEANLWAYYPLDENDAIKPLDRAGNHHFTVNGCTSVETNKPPTSFFVPTALVCSEYSMVSVDPKTKEKTAIMRRLFAYPTSGAVAVLQDKRIDSLEMNWIGNAQIKPTLIGFIEGAPPVPTENLTVADDYNGATSVELVQSEDVEYSWTREEESSLGGRLELFHGIDVETEAGFGVFSTIFKGRVGLTANTDFSYHWQNSSSVGASHSLMSSERLELRGYQEKKPHFPHLGNRFIPKNVGYALVVSGMADVFVSRLQRSGRMIGYHVLPVPDIPMDVNTITFRINPAYTMAGSLDGMTGSRATSQRFFRHVPGMRSQLGSLYPASYFRLKEAYDLKKQIEQQDKLHESYFYQFNAGLVDQASLNRQVDDSSKDGSTVGVNNSEFAAKDEDQEIKKLDKDIAAAQTRVDELEAKNTRKDEEQAELIRKKKDIRDWENQKQTIRKNQQSKQKDKTAQTNEKISEAHTDLSTRAHAADCFAAWQQKMENLQLRAGKRNIVNTYVWDGDGGLHAEEQEFATTVEHSVGGSLDWNFALGLEVKLSLVAVTTELTAQRTVSLTQTMSKTQRNSKGLELHVELPGVEHRGVTDYNDKPMLPGEKVDRYRFMSFFLENNVNHWHDFFNYVVDPEWLASNDEEARALRQAQKANPNAVWRVLHRVTYVERPALMGFGSGMGTIPAAPSETDDQSLSDRIAKLEAAVSQLSKNLAQSPFSITSDAAKAQRAN